MNFKKTCLPVVSAAALSFFMCEDNSPSGAGKINPEDLQGTWNVVVMEESWNLTEDGVPDVGNEREAVTDTSMLFVVNATQIMAYDNFESSCYDLSTESYTLSGNRLLGEELTGQEEGYSWNTTVALNGNQLVITYTENMTSPDETGWNKTVITMNRFAGAVPPANWPTDVCDDSFSKKAKKHFLQQLGR